MKTFPRDLLTPLENLEGQCMQTKEEEHFWKKKTNKTYIYISIRQLKTNVFDQKKKKHIT